jgi:hypothetical protein
LTDAPDLPAVQREAGPVSEVFAPKVLRDLVACLGLKTNTAPEMVQRKVAGVIDAMAAFEAQNEVEAMLASAAVASHSTGMAALRRATPPEMPSNIASRACLKIGSHGRLD